MLNWFENIDVDVLNEGSADFKSSFELFAGFVEFVTNNNRHFSWIQLLVRGNYFATIFWIFQSNN